MCGVSKWILGELCFNVEAVRTYHVIDAPWTAIGTHGVPLIILESHGCDLSLLPAFSFHRCEGTQLGPTSDLA
jgi:hypothetical protein